MTIKEAENALTIWHDQNLIFRDGDLEKSILSSRFQSGTFGNFKELILPEVESILVAFRSPQYEKFIKHLLHSYTDFKKIHPMAGNGECKCCVCKNKLFQYSKWSCNDSMKAYISTESNLPICLNCLVQLNFAKDILMDLGQLDYYKNN